MFTILQTLSIITLIFTGVTFFVYMVIYLLDLTMGQDYKVLKSKPRHFLIFALLLIFSFSLAMVSSRHLSEMECTRNQGEFRSWDAGAAWECYNPNLIQQNNNFRIVDQGE